MAKEKVLFFLCMALVLVIGFLAGLIAGPRIMHPHFGRDGGGMRRRMDFDHDRGMEDNAAFKKKMKGHFIDMLGQELSLTDAQKLQIGKIMDENEPEFLATRQKMKKTFDDMNAKIDARISQALTDKQKEKFKEITSRMREHGPGIPPPPVPGGPRGFGGDHP